MKLGVFTLWTMLLLPFAVRASDLPVNVALSYDMIKGLPKDARCLDRVRDVFPNLVVSDIPWKRIMLNLEYGKTDLTPCLFKTPKRAEFTDHFGPIASLRIIMVFQEHRDLNLEAISPLQGVFLRGTSLIKQYTTPGMKILEVNSIDTVLQMIKHDRADYTLMPENFVNDRDTDGLKVITVAHMPLYIGVSKKSPRNKEILQVLNQKIPIKHLSEF